jgi:hypothetical protein
MLALREEILNLFQAGSRLPPLRPQLPWGNSFARLLKYALPGNAARQPLAGFRKEFDGYLREYAGRPTAKFYQTVTSETAREVILKLKPTGAGSEK